MKTLINLMIKSTLRLTHCDAAYFELLVREYRKKKNFISDILSRHVSMISVSEKSINV